MAVDLTDAQIRSLIAAPKDLPEDYAAALRRVKVVRKHEKSSVDASSPAGRFVIILRQNTINALDFSAILGYHMPSSSRVFRLRRYNGSHQHRNPIEDQEIEGFHIHEATERYQAKGPREEVYAESTDRYTSLNSALRCLIKDCNFKEPAGAQGSLFSGW